MLLEYMMKIIYDGIIKDYIDICTFDNLDENKDQLIGYDNFKYDQNVSRLI